MRTAVVCFCIVGVIVSATPVAAQQAQPSQPAAAGSGGPQPPFVFDMGEIQVVGSQEGQPGIAGTVLSSDQVWTFDRKSLDQAVNLVPGVVSTFDANGRRNESDIFVRGFGR